MCVDSLSKHGVIAVDGFAIRAQQKGGLRGRHMRTKAPYYFLLLRYLLRPLYLFISQSSQINDDGLKPT